VKACCRNFICTRTIIQTREAKGKAKQGETHNAISEVIFKNVEGARDHRMLIFCSHTPSRRTRNTVPRTQTIAQAHFAQQTAPGANGTCTVTCYRLSIRSQIIVVAKRLKNRHRHRLRQRPQHRLQLSALSLYLCLARALQCFKLFFFFSFIVAFIFGF